MIEIEPILDKFKRFGFRNAQGQELTDCTSFQELAFLAMAQIQNHWTEITDDPATWPPLNQQVWGLGADGTQNTFKRIGNAPGWNRDYADIGPKFAERVTHWRPKPLSPGVESEISIHCHQDEQGIDEQPPRDSEQELAALEKELASLQFCFSPNHRTMRRMKQVEALIADFKGEHHG